MHARKTILFHDDKPWAKRNNANDFDVPMGSYDGAEVCELIGTFMLSEISTVIDKNDIGLYRDDGLGIMKRLGGPTMERKKKQIVQIFKRHKLNITVEANLQTVEYLDVLFDLKNDTFKPYRKPNNDPLYINMKSNHPPSVLKHIPKGIGKRLSEVSSSEEIFKEAVPLYEDALKASGFDEKLVYTNNAHPPQYRRNRRRKIIWYNPPYSSNVKSNIGKIFLGLINTHFHKQHVLHKVFNRNTVKISYSCMRNISAVISSHNKSMMRKDATPERECNCPNKDDCPLDNKCLSSNIIYEAEVTSQPENVVKHYRGLCSTDFK